MLSTLTKSKSESGVDYQISGLVRGQEQAKLLEQNGIKPVLFDDLDASEQLQEIASHFDGKRREFYLRGTSKAKGFFSGRSYCLRLP